jgi:hypothetical protein
MKLFLALASLVALASGKKTFSAKKALANMQVPLKDVKADSPLGAKLLSQARKLDQEEEEDFTWVSGYSIKFQGCHHISQWNDEADGEEDVRIMTKRLVRFRLCPTTDCATANAGGCDSGYGEYIIDMNTYLASYVESLENYNEYRCEYIAEMVCDCADDDGKGDDFDQDICLWDCYVENEVEAICAENNPYEEEGAEEEEAFELGDYMECARWEVDNGRRRLDQEVEYYMGPYCADNGGSIFLGIFTDEACTTYADEYGGKELYKTVTGTDLPYGEASVIDMECFACKEPADINNEGDDADDEDEIIEMCEQLYQQAGKCETNLATGGTLNTNACTYMEGIKIVRKNGSVMNSSTANKTASIFIGIFVVAFVLLAAYVYYLKTKLDRASINLSE